MKHVFRKENISLSGTRKEFFFGNFVAEPFFLKSARKLVYTGHLDAANLLAIDVVNPHVWDIVEPHTPPRVKLGLQSPSKKRLVYSSFRRRRMDFCSMVK